MEGTGDLDLKKQKQKQKNSDDRVVGRKAKIGMSLGENGGQERLRH